ncbi:TPA: hypothetical protein ACH3X2_011514 [Trebouxia sp. C0005]
MRHADFGSGLSPLPSPPALLNTQQRPYTPGNLQSLLPWDFNRWGGLPTDVEANVAQGFRLREQQQQQQQQQQAQQQAQHQQHLQQQHSAVFAQRAADSDFRHLSSDFSFLQPSPQSGDPQGGQRQLGSQLQYNLPSTSAGMAQADQYGFPEALSGEEGGNEAFLPYSGRLLRQEGSERQAVLPWGIQESGLFDAMGGISPEPSAHFGNSAPDMCMSLPMHGRYSGEQLQSGPLSRVQSPELQSGHNSFSDWSQPTGRGLLERVGQIPHQESTEHAQAVQHATLSAYDDRLWPRQGPSQQLQQPQQPPPATTDP